MSLSVEEIQGLADAVGMWHMQEYIAISFYAFYIYYVLTTIDEEAAAILPQKRTCGKGLFLLIRYCTLVFIAMHLSRDYRNYSTISPSNCKAMMVIYDVAYFTAEFACAVSLGLCLGALLQLEKWYIAPLTMIAAGPSLVALIFAVVSDAQIPGTPVSGLDVELGYPCYVPPNEEWLALTISGRGRDIRRYVTFATTAFLLILASATLTVRHRGHKGRLIQVLLRDGGLYYITLTAIRFGDAIVNTPAIIPVDELGGSAAAVVVEAATYTVIPILAQRLLINMRQVDYMGSRPVASKLLFAPPAPGSEDNVDSFEMDVGHSGVGAGSQTRDPSRNI